MKPSACRPSDPTSRQQEYYPLKGASAHMSRRTVQKQAQFFLPQLRAILRSEWEQRLSIFQEAASFLEDGRKCRMQNRTFQIERSLD